MYYYIFVYYLVVPKCGQQVQSSIVPLIENGVPVTLGTFPWIVAIYDKTQVSTNRLICSGSIITPYAILSGEPAESTRTFVLL